LVVTVELSGVLEEALEALVAAGLYQSKSEAVRDAVRRLLESLDLRDVALRAYTAAGFTFQAAAEASRAGLVELAGYFASRGVVPELGSVDRGEVTRGAELLEARGVAVVDLSALELMVYSGLAGALVRPGVRLPRLVAPASLEARVRLLPYTGRVRLGVPLPRWLVAVARPRRRPPPRRGVSLQELEAASIAREEGAVYLSCDARSRAVARSMGVEAAPLQSLLLLLLERGDLRRGDALIYLDRLAAVPAAVAVEV
jgi:Arc/MetJ-type ribon-helix-helix transcriptional regulator